MDLKVGDKVVRNDKYWEGLPLSDRDDSVQTVLAIDERFSWPVTISYDCWGCNGTEFVDFDEVDVVND